MRVLYVEDSVADADLTRRVLARKAPHIELEVVGSLQEARARLSARRRDQPFDLLLTDLNLPDGSGLELLSGILLEGMKLPVILITGQGDEHSAVAALKGGATGYLVKREGYLETLPQTLEETLHKSGRRDPMAHPLEVLYAEPHAADAELTRIHLAQYAPHIQLEVVHTAEQVLRRLPEDPSTLPAYQVLLLDYRLPGMDALELTRILRRERHLAIPIILITGQGTEDSAAAALQLEVDDYLVKREGYLHALPATLEKVQRQVELAREKAALQETSERLNHILAASATVLFKLRVEPEHLRPSWISTNVEQLLGYRPEEVMARGWWREHLHPQDGEAVLTARQAFLDQDELQREYRLRHRDGHYLWLRDRLRLLRDDRGRPLEVVGTWTDISREKETARLRNARMAVHGLIFDGAPLERVLEELIHQLEDIFPEWQGTALLFDGKDSHLTVGQAPDLATLPAELAPQLLWPYSRAAIDALRAPDQADLGQGPFCHRGAEPGQASGLPAACVFPLRGGQGRLLGLLNFYARQYQPLTPELQGRLAEFSQMAALAVERVQTEQNLRQAAAVLANTHDGVVVTDLKPAILSVNKAWCDMTGYSPEEALGRNPSLLKSNLQEPGFYATMWQALRTHGDWQGEIWNRRKNGETYPQFLSISTVRDGNGHPTHYVGVMTDLSRLKQSEEERDRLTHYDPLTHLPNRLLALSRLEHAIEQARRDNLSIGVIYLDLDHFKTINDSLGHPIGDQVLQLLALRLKERLRGKDTLARLGGDEFLVILERLENPDEAARVGQCILDLLHQPVSLADGRDIYVGGSLGISLYPEDGQTPHELIQHADTALYEAKKQGRDTFCFYTADLSQQVRLRLNMETHMRRALERGEFSLHYQPQVDIRSGLVNGVEALMRWESPELGKIPPGQFIPVAEQSGLILPMGAWALAEACRQNKAWQDEGLPPLVMAVNVSVRQFKSQDLVSVVQQALAQSGLAPCYLEIELTESAFVEDAEVAIATSHRLHQLGVKLSLDDFGTGYSSLAYLSRFPFDKIKIDQSFVRDIASNPTNAAIANATIALAESLHMSVLAEGVETESQLNFLRQRGCASMQGFLFSRALVPREFAALLREARRLPAAPDQETQPHTLLLLDDEPNILRALQRLLRQDGYRILATTDPREAFEMLAQNRVQVIVSDQRMPEMSGTEFLSRVKEMYPDTIRIVLSGYSEIETITQAVNRGAIYKFFTKPWDDAQLRENLREAFRVAEKLARP